MNKYSLMVCSVLMFQPFMARAQQNTAPQYMIETRVLACPTGQVSFSSIKTPRSAPILGVISGPVDLEINVGDGVAPTKWHVGEGDFDVSSLPKNFDLLTAPRVTTLANCTAEVRVTQYVQYFEKQRDGSFQLRQMPTNEWVGVAVDYTIKPQNADGNEVAVDAGFKVNWIQSRETITNVFLDVGKPVIVHNTTRVTMTMKTGLWCLFSSSGSVGGLGRSMLALFRVQQVDPTGRPIEKYSDRPHLKK